MFLKVRLTAANLGITSSLLRLSISNFVQGSPRNWDSHRTNDDLVSSSDISSRKSRPDPCLRHLHRAIHRLVFF
ncbi:hypothetical protein CPC08DRAFT_764052 [Agrocybe pediades]|nr:hypothetical protein CPC08DRAFT_764052 [Agrocybe pediades]